jgi:hypothetical protein
MVEHKNKTRKRINVEKTLLIGLNNSDPLQQAHQTARDPISHQESEYE